jgi:hypothetical protein
VFGLNGEIQWNIAQFFRNGLFRSVNKPHGANTYATLRTITAGPSLCPRSSPRSTSIIPSRTAESSARAGARGRLLDLKLVCMASTPVHAGTGSSKPKVGVLGVGLMGSKMCRRLHQEGFSVLAWNRDPQKTVALREVSFGVAC